MWIQLKKKKKDVKQVKNTLSHRGTYKWDESLYIYIEDGNIFFNLTSIERRFKINFWS